MSPSQRRHPRSQPSVFCSTCISIHFTLSHLQGIRVLAAVTSRWPKACSSPHSQAHSGCSSGARHVSRVTRREISESSGRADKPSLRGWGPMKVCGWVSLSCCPVCGDEAADVSPWKQVEVHLPAWTCLGLRSESLQVGKEPGAGPQAHPRFIHSMFTEHVRVPRLPACAGLGSLSFLHGRPRSPLHTVS